MSLWVALPAALMIIAGIVAQVASISRLDLRGLLVGWLIAMGGQTLCTFLARGNDNVGKNLLTRLKHLATAAVDTFLYGTGIGNSKYVRKIDGTPLP